ncbi:PssE/Cps14G family polysaccharide biosynthesis glycosyltransferase [Alteribacillus sp. HJP-4]|uniref:PssE/Cps14G family polysaccharide biosynthesis glycosyltransferase n=1 Tax=Alteribacillus sp. HJP-4 TaxID=2775394 RepID=UPI0035CD0A6F
MILVVLGTHELPFTRLLKKVDELIESGSISEEVFVQSGHTKYQSENMTLQPFISYEEMDNKYDEASIIIAHGGTGSIISGVKKGKPVIAVPRLAKYKEHNDDHQLEIVEQFSEAGHIIGVEELELLDAALLEAKSFTPVPFQSGREKIFRLLEDFIDRA